MFTSVLLFTGLVASAFASPVLTGKRSADGTTNVPYLAALEVDGRYFCGAAIISESWLVSSAWCLARDLDRYVVRVGSSVKESGGVTVGLESIRRFDYFGFPLVLDQNLGIAKLSEPLEFSDTIQPIALTKLTDQTPVGSVGTISGWGTFPWVMGPIFDDVQSTETTVISDAECVSAYPNNRLSFGTFCTGVPAAGNDGYQGDYGNPLVIDGQLHGVLSLSYGFADLEQPRAYSKISYFRRWIEQYTGV